MTRGFCEMDLSTTLLDATRRCGLWCFSEDQNGYYGCSSLGTYCSKFWTQSLMRITYIHVLQCIYIRIPNLDQFGWLMPSCLITILPRRRPCHPIISHPSPEATRDWPTVTGPEWSIANTARRSASPIGLRRGGVGGSGLVSHFGRRYHGGSWW